MAYFKVVSQKFDENTEVNISVVAPTTRISTWQISIISYYIHVFMYTCYNFFVKVSFLLCYKGKFKNYERKLCFYLGIVVFCFSL
jgi:hypothetical protein